MLSKRDVFELVQDDIHFDSLWERARETVEQFGGQVWTDTGEHDPGVTFLQGYAYGASDLGYRHTLPLVDLLTPPLAEQTEGGGVFPAEFGPHQALTCGPITLEDYRRALLDLTDSTGSYFLFRNVQLLPLDSDGSDARQQDYRYYYSPQTLEFSFKAPNDKAAVKYWLRGNYSLRFERTREALVNTSEPDKQLHAFLTDHRNLCESVTHTICETWQKLNPLVEIELNEHVQDYAAVFAELYRTGEDYVSPRVSHETADTLEGRGASATEIYDGPCLSHGWQSRLPPATDYTVHISVNLSGLAARWTRIAGVKSVRSIRTEQATSDPGWEWRSDVGYYPLLWGDDPLTKMTSSVKLITADGRYVTATKAEIEAKLASTPVEDNPPKVLPYGKVRDVAQYHPVTDKMPACYNLQLPLNAGGPQALYQFLLPFEQAMSNSCRQLAMLPALLSFIRQGETTWGAQWPYAEGSAGDGAHSAYKTDLIEHSASAAVDGVQERKLIDHLLGYFGTEAASPMLDTSKSEFLTIQQSALSQITTLAYQRASIRVDQVSALQKRIAARMGWGQALFDDDVDMGALPFYLVEHRALLPQKPSSLYDSPMTPEQLTLSADNRMLTVVCSHEHSLDQMLKGQLIEFTYTNESGTHVAQGGIVDSYDSHAYTFSIDLTANPFLRVVLEPILTAQDNKKLTWNNAASWLKKIVYPLRYGPGTSETPGPEVQLTIPDDFPFPSCLQKGDTVSINSITQLGIEPWSMKVEVVSVDRLAGMLSIKPVVGEQQALPAVSAQESYAWHALDSTDRFSMIVSLVLNRNMLPQNGDVYATEAWIKRCVQAELQAHIRLMIHWLDEDESKPQSFGSFALSYAAWQNAQTVTSTSTFQITWKLGLGRPPAGLNTGIGALRIATPEQRDAVLGPDGDQWNIDVLFENALFFVPEDVFGKRNGFN
ncbi:hypothetical protein [Caballeronia sp. LZ034LL]|uniref:hypothetical protein n=1 Tax=Caballeronia sp. LZ034LL TaxID=3038567 RepID=UPI002861B51F|nr:hypothetical protein [Caballeronia sp. LZ034LL]MDR5837931.1 hypothetical protein [Caballeronia sp. LZ034LL]